MGLCTEFATQIVAGCHEPMIAGTDSCSCRACGAVCTGKFAGCADVWAAGPSAVSIRLTNVRKQPQPSPHRNGNGTSAATSTSEADVAPLAVSAPVAFHDAGMGITILDTDILRSVLKEVDRLRNQLELAQPVLSATSNMSDLSDSVASVRSVLEELPDRIASALASALSLQHRAIMADVRRAMDEFSDKIEASLFRPADPKPR